ncbi:hypothetical protein [Pseudomonas antarctica]|uniref:hypothetical protein n=1 Tax=Pseudomonas antarctica TaxID=219572 RepID=UPI00387AE6B0
MALNMTNSYRLRLECVRNLSPNCADLAGRIAVALRTETLTQPTAILIEGLFDHLDAVVSQHNGSVTRLGVWMCGLVYAKALLSTEAEIFLADAAILGGPSSLGPA